MTTVYIRTHTQTWFIWNACVGVPLQIRIPTLTVPPTVIDAHEQVNSPWGHIQIRIQIKAPRQSPQQTVHCSLSGVLSVSFCIKRGDTEFVEKAPLRGSAIVDRITLRSHQSQYSRVCQVSQFLRPVFVSVHQIEIDQIDLPSCNHACVTSDCD